MHDQRGYSLLEMLIALTLVGGVSASLMQFLLQNSRLNRQQQMLAEVQANARITLSLVVQTLRSAGWDPALAGIPAIVPDPDPSDGIDQIEVFADHDADGTTDQEGEQVLIRHVGDRVEWRRTSTSGFETLAVGISNDADGDGVVERMFVPNPDPDPTRIRVRVTARSPVPDPVSGRFLVHTVTSDVVLRQAL